VAVQLLDLHTLSAPVPDNVEMVIDQLTDLPAINFVADNVDHNIRTLDGLGTFHAMGVISATVVPSGMFCKTQRVVRRLDKPTKTCEATRNTRVPILSFETYEKQGVSTIKLCKIRSLQRPLTMPMIANLNTVWHAAGMVGPGGQPRSNWSGFMQSVCKGEHTGVSAVEMLCILDLNPSDDDCIYSTLVFVASQAKARNIPTPNITFDQPLYIKAVDIALKSDLNIVVRLGGFHTLMSFLGSIGHLMKASGLEEVLGLFFGPNTVEQVLSGTAYARAVRGHFLIHAALTDLLLDYLRNPASTSESAARLHAMRVHLQAVLWGSLGDVMITATDWGWRLQDSIRLIPTQIDGEVAPEHILTVVRCKCKGNCASALCSCQKNGLHCVSACSSCHGTECSNVRGDVIADSDGSDDECEADTSEIDVENRSTAMQQILWDDDMYFLYEEEV